MGGGWLSQLFGKLAEKLKSQNMKNEWWRLNIEGQRSKVEDWRLKVEGLFLSL